ncbi:MAG: FAD-dependent oxidoreductase [Clostridia bacterium]|nr:FAD-dependent oxidoreductase [Clostridia bacterium]
MEKNLSRRSFLKGTVASAAGLMAANFLGSGAIGESAEPDGVVLKNLGGTGVVTLTNDAVTQYDGIYDVVVVGAGGAGMSAAFEAANAGASVLVLEHEPGILQSNTALCGGVVMGCLSSVQKAAGVEDDVDEFRKYLSAVGEGYEDPDMMDVWARESGGTVDWLIEQGVNFPTEKLYMSGNEPNYEHITKAVPRGCITAEDSGSSICQALYDRTVEMGVEYRFNVTASRLITDPDGRVVGVLTNKGIYRGNKAVILCTAGFSRNQQWIKSFKPDLATGGSFGSSYQQGDGIKMGMAVGAQIGNMWITQADTIGTQLTEEMCPCMVIAIWKLPCIFVSQDGRRHMAEDLYYEYQCGEIAAQEGGYVWSIWDQSITDMGSSVITVPACSDGCEDEIANGTIFRADTIAELAVQLNIDPAVLEETVNHYNEMMRNGVDEDFGRASGLGEVVKAPFYAAKTVPATCDTAGGLITNTDGQVKNQWGDIIPGLYAAGSTTSGWRGKLYPGSGTAVSVAVTFGRRAGRLAASEAGSAYMGTLSDNPYAEDEVAAVETADNEFIGTGNGMGGAVRVKVTVNDGRMTNIEIIEQKETPGISDNALTSLPEAILQAQSVDIDGVSGSTITSNAIKEAVADAMRQAGLM